MELPLLKILTHTDKDQLKQYAILCKTLKLYEPGFGCIEDFYNEWINSKYNDECVAVIAVDTELLPIGIAITEWRPKRSKQRTVHLTNTFVDPKWRKRGIGTYLVNTLKKESEKYNINIVGHKDGTDGSHIFYEKCGLIIK